MKKFLALALVMVGLSGCAISAEQVQLARELMAQSGSNCVHIDGGAIGMTLPMAGATTGLGYRGSLSAAHSENDHPVSCDTNGSKVDLGQ